MKFIRKNVKIIIPILAGILIIGLLLSRVFQPGSEPEPEIRIEASEAINYIGRTAEVCGAVASVSFLSDITGQPTFINFDEPYPDQTFTVVIWGENRHSWHHPPEDLYENREICVSGRIRLHEGSPQIIASSPDQIKP